MPPKSENSDHPNTLPPPELNPLLNPLLAAHMGRWAEVYFTSPPERRDHAVWELVRELEAEQSSGTATAVTSSTNGGKASTQASSAREFSEAREADLRARFSNSAAEVRPDLAMCAACGFENPPRQRFCGMCGTRLVEASGAVSAPPPGSPPQLASASETHRNAESNPISGPDPAIEPSQSSEEAQRTATSQSSERNPESETGSSSHVLDDFPWRRDETSLFRIAEEVRPRGIRGSLFADTSEGPRPYRRYLVAAIVVAVFALAYLTWRAMQNQQSEQTHSSAQEAVPVSAPVASPAQSAAPNQRSTTEPPAAQPSDIAASVSASAPANAISATKTHAGEITNTNHEPAPNSSTPPITAAAAPDAITPQTAESSATDLATARSYLNGDNGHERNSSEGAEWLWRAVSKKNGEATLLLADLYLRGDGVAKNCDQARLLLDAAARKGSKDAAERLRNLQAFGCQ